MAMITSAEIIGLRLQNQQIADSRFRSPAALVGHMGAMQAQHYEMVKYAIGLRIPAATKGQVERALDSGKIIRTHALRPTWHLIRATDLTGVLQLTAPRILASLKTRHRQLGLSAEVLQKAFHTFQNVLKGHPGRSREELLSALQKTGVKTQGDNRGAHILMAAELNQIICSGKQKGKQSTYALYPAAAATSGDLSHERLTAWLAEKYFTSHGPATAADFSWWSGLTLTAARQGLAAIAAKLASVTLGGERYWYRKGTDRLHGDTEKAYLIPAFDELVVSYKNKAMLFQPKDKSKAISSNGIFWPVVLINGQATGLWKLVKKTNGLQIQTTLFRRHSAKEKALIRAAASRAGSFYQEKIEVGF